MNIQSSSKRVIPRERIIHKSPISGVYCGMQEKVPRQSPSAEEDKAYSAAEERTSTSSGIQRPGIYRLDDISYVATFELFHTSWTRII